uniref:Succinate:cytochrome c oxidoreductase subunit 3 n=1 Tax=Palmaria palmata TaxID=2822 RepID=A0A0A7A6K6_PALPL|nr:succinate:cytochrome c oxidoreductase subunit 3 [Palmaria palmata]AHB62156.1 succinate:cytochrome c oxidoreductase subunit 3 [Palmaria palmata]
MFKIPVKFFNRPISPHLTIYLPQIASLFSIWHRLSAIVILCYLLVFIYTLKLYLWVSLIEVNNLLELVYKTGDLQLTRFLLALVLSYHVLNGLRHIKSSLGYTLENNKLNKSVVLFIICLSSFQFINNL